MKLMTWFTKRRFADLIPDECVIVGGTCLVREFIDHISSYSADAELAIAAPFMTPEILGELQGLGSLRHGAINCTVVVGDSGSAYLAAQELTKFGWRSIEVLRSSHLHAKAYAFLARDGSAVALIGSHNLTRAGVSRNEEAGVLIVTRHRSPLSSIVGECIDHIRNVGRAGHVLYDSMMQRKEHQLLRRSA